MSNERSCLNDVSWCGGPDRYGETCKACLEIWAAEGAERKPYAQSVQRSESEQ